MCLNQKSGKKAQVSLSKQRTLSRHLQIYAQIAVMFAVCMLKRRVRVNSSWRKSAFWHSCVPFQVLCCKWGFKGVIYIMLKRRGKHFTRCITKSFLKSYCPSDRTLNGAPRVRITTPLARKRQSESLGISKKRRLMMTARETSYFLHWSLFILIIYRKKNQLLIVLNIEFVLNQHH